MPFKTSKKAKPSTSGTIKVGEVFCDHHKYLKHDIIDDILLDTSLTGAEKELKLLTAKSLSKRVFKDKFGDTTVGELTKEFYKGDENCTKITKEEYVEQATDFTARAIKEQFINVMVMDDLTWAEKKKLLICYKDKEFYKMMFEKPSKTRRTAELLFDMVKDAPDSLF